MVLSGTAAVACFLVALVAWYLLVQHVLPAPDVQRWSKRYRVVRRHLESLRSWETRIEAAAEARDTATRDFVAEAERLGRLERVSARGGIRWSLPAAHPKALALTAARFPDGLPPEEVERVAGGLDVDEYGVAFG